MIVALLCPLCRRLVTQQVLAEWPHKELFCAMCVAAPQRVREYRYLIYRERLEQVHGSDDH